MQVSGMDRESLDVTFRTDGDPAITALVEFLLQCWGQCCFYRQVEHVHGSHGEREQVN